MLIEEYVNGIVSYELPFGIRRYAFDGEQVSRVFFNLRHNKPQMSKDDQKCLENHISTQVKKAYEAQRNLLEVSFSFLGI